MKINHVSRRMVLLSGASSWLVPQLSWAQSNEREVEGGIGGTGIVGILTDFGSLIVSGNRIETDGATRFTDGFGEVSGSSLAKGDSLTIEATTTPSGLLAKRVHVTHPLIGRIETLSGDGKTLRINGTNVQLAQGQRRFNVGDRVAVSGLWRGDSVEASGLSKARTNFDLVSGDLGIGGTGTKRIGGVSVLRSDLRAIENGAFVTAIGKYNPSKELFVATQAKAGRFTGAAGPLVRLSIEGYLDPIRRAPGYKLSGLGHSFKRNLDLSRFKDRRVLFNGPYVGTFAANSALVLPDSSQTRAALLRQLSKG